MTTKPIEVDIEDENEENADEFEGAETIIMSSDDDDDGDLDVSMEVNVERLIAEMDKTKSSNVGRKKEIRQRLEEIQEARSIEDTYSFDLYGED